MDEFFVVDRVENNIAVLECPDGKFLNVEVDSLPFKVREGNVLLKQSDGTFTLSNDEEKKRKHCEEYGLVYVFRKGERERLKRKKDAEDITLKLPF